jgi:hypothetical protein
MSRHEEITGNSGLKQHYNPGPDMKADSQLFDVQSCGLVAYRKTGYFILDLDHFHAIQSR